MNGSGSGSKTAPRWATCREDAASSPATRCRRGRRRRKRLPSRRSRRAAIAARCQASTGPPRRTARRSGGRVERWRIRLPATTSARSRQRAATAHRVRDGRSAPIPAPPPNDTIASTAHPGLRSTGSPSTCAALPASSLGATIALRHRSGQRAASSWPTMTAHAPAINAASETADDEYGDETQALRRSSDDQQDVDRDGQGNASTRTTTATARRAPTTARRRVPAPGGRRMATRRATPATATATAMVSRTRPTSARGAGQHRDGCPAPPATRGEHAAGRARSYSDERHRRPARGRRSSSTWPTTPATRL